MRLTGETRRLDEVSDLDREQMLALMQRYYEGVRREDFEHDLSGKDWVIMALPADIHDPRFFDAVFLSSGDGRPSCRCAVFRRHDRRFAILGEESVGNALGAIGFVAD